MVAAGRVFPGILHVHADIVAAFDFDAVDFESESAAGNADHAVGALRGAGGGLDGHDLLRQEVADSWGKVESGFVVSARISREESVQRGVGRLRCQHRAVAEASMAKDSVACLCR